MGNDRLRTVLTHLWKVVFFALLIALCAVYAPQAPLKFIYTEF
jgi:hypothetical protein